MRARARLALLAAGVMLAALGGTAQAGGLGSLSFDTYPAPALLGNGAGEPSIGVSWTSGATLVESDTQTLKATFDDSREPARATWTNVTTPLAVTSADPILWTDSTTGRTFESQLFEACSLMASTDDDGLTWIPSQGCGGGAFLDHQTVGGGPYAAPLAGGTPGYPHAVYYCAQFGLAADCSRSDDGGHTFGAGVPIYDVPGVDTAQQASGSCTGLHGHVRVAPDGAVYVPNFDCDGHVAVSVSEDNGLTWQVREVAHSTTQDESDPSVAAGSKSTVYLAWEEGKETKIGSRAYAAVSHDHGRSWLHSQDLGARLGIRNIQFPEVIAGDDNRAAVAFLGTTSGGDDQRGGQVPDPVKDSVFSAVWRLYVSMTYDGGVHWTTVDATPHSIIQRGCIWLFGGGGSCRNLLDFNDIAVDRQGRVEVVFADGCIGPCETADLSGRDDYNSTAHAPTYRARHLTVSRQSGGKGLVAAFDGRLFR